MQYWLVKTEPESYSLSDLKGHGEEIWDGVRNFQARNFLEKMNLGDKVFVYHSGKQKAVAGLAEVSGTAFPDPNSNSDEKWLAVKIKYLKTFEYPVSLKEIKSTAALTNMMLIKQSRLSVMPLQDDEAKVILTMAKV
ncbi:MAG: EVE domain-containing protein [Cyclobacteriaceae bacterium]